MMGENQLPDNDRVAFWSSCSGCTDGVDGYVNDVDHPLHPIHNVPQGIGCDECNNTGIVWQDWGTASQLEAWAKECLA